MKILFLDTSSFFVTISIIDNNNIVFNYQEEIRDDMSSKIMPIISGAFNKINFGIKDINKIIVVNGPGSFTGVRIGVTIAKTLAYTLNIPISTVSSLEYLATTSVSSKYVIPMIDARRGYVFGGVYDNDLNSVYRDSYILFNDLSSYFNEGTIVTFSNYGNSVNPSLDVLKIVNKHINDKPLNPHSVNPNYLKKTEAEEKLGA